jgi:hypothetical protein
VAGTMVAAGVDYSARGMAPEAILDAYDWRKDNMEMSIAASQGLAVSNHSYGIWAGWGYNEENEKWYWYGDRPINEIEDYRFGFYGTDARACDLIAYHAPYYLIVAAGGNERRDRGPKPGEGHYHWKGEWVWSTDYHQPDGGADGYDTMSGQVMAKNILAVGAVLDIPDGYQEPSDVIQTTYSSWGPTDDGRIKPDIVANGDKLHSTSVRGIAVYDTMGGTSSASPGVAGSASLLVDHFRAVKGLPPRASTLKALVIFGADEAGQYPGPDYQNGWGLMNTARSASVIDQGGIVETFLLQGGTRMFTFSLDSPTDVRTTMAWTDPPHSMFVLKLDNPTRALVNDLDVRVEHIASSTIYEPWALDRTDPSRAATQRDNRIDNIEQIDMADAPAGEYRIIVSHKGPFATGRQWFSLVCSEPVADYLVADHRVAWVDNAVQITWTMTNVVPGFVVHVSRKAASDPTPQLVQGEIRENGSEMVFRDALAQGGETYTYEVSIVENSSEIAGFETTITTPPHLLGLEQNRPNPFWPATVIDFTMPDDGPAALRIYDVAGRLVRTLISGTVTAGPHSEPWNGLDDNGNRVASGVYFYRLQTGGQTFTRKLVLLR